MARGWARRVVYSLVTPSWLLVVVELSRASSYMFRAPVITPEISGVIENLLPYVVWLLLLVASAAFIVVGIVARKRVALLGHLIGGCCYLTFGSSVFFGALLYGENWASGGTLYLIALLHFSQVVRIGDQLRGERER